MRVNSITLITSDAICPVYMNYTESFSLDPMMAYTYLYPPRVTVDAAYNRSI